MSVLKYRDPVTGEIKKVNAPIDDTARIHADNKNNPHNVTASQIGAAPIGHVEDKNNPHGITAAQIGAASKSTSITATLLAANWVGNEAPYTYTLNINGITSSSNQEYLNGIGMTADQVSVLQAANILDGGQSTNTATLLAYGIKPEIDLPIRVILRGDA